jgi:carboxyl-terminal processing protease
MASGKIQKAFLPIFLAVLTIGSVLAFMIQPSPSESQVVSSTSSVVSEEVSVSDVIAEYIVKGDFDEAEHQLDILKGHETDKLSQLRGLVADYKKIDSRRQSGRREIFDKKLNQLTRWETHDFNSLSDIFDTNDPNNEKNDGSLEDVNNLRVALSVIAGAGEFADANDKKKLLADNFVKDVISRSIVKAGEFESKGKWLDAYINSYSWLKVIDKDNKGYSQYCDKLLAKANIVASFQDSPCETSRERYTGIKKKMVIRAMDTLDALYVSPVNYLEMAKKGIERSDLLGDVMRLSYSEIVKSKSDLDSDQNDDGYFPRPEADKLAQWSRKLRGLLQKIKQPAVVLNKDKFIDLFEQVLQINKDTVCLPEKVLIAQFTEAAFSALDPYTTMVWPKQVSDFDKLMTNEFTGVGIEISWRDGFLTAASLLPDTPAYKSGLDAGDRILKVDGVSTKDMTLTCAVKHITGPAGTKVTLTVQRVGEEKTRDITITRAKIVVRTIRGWRRTEGGKWDYIVDDKNRIGYIRLTSFSGETADDLEKALDQLESDGMKGLILDLRFNPGGLLTSAIDIVDKFVTEGLIVSTRPRGMQLGNYAVARKWGTHKRYPLVILINSSSASASEIVSGALGDDRHDRAILVGERTHGKGSVQQITTYPGGGSQLKYTMAYYHLPGGQRVESRQAMEKLGSEEWGVAADVECKLLSDEVTEIFKIRRDNDVLAQAGNGNGNDKKKHSIDEVLEADYQLATGLLVVKAELLKDDAGL